MYWYYLKFDDNLSDACFVLIMLALHVWTKIPLQHLKHFTKEGEIIHYEKSILYVCNKYNYGFNQIGVYIDIFIIRLETQHTKSHQSPRPIMLVAPQTRCTGETPDLPNQWDSRPTVPRDLDLLCRETYQCTSWWPIFWSLWYYGVMSTCLL